MTGDLFQGGLLEGPLYPLKPGVSRGPPGLSGARPLSPPPVIRPLAFRTSYWSSVATKVTLRIKNVTTLILLRFTDITAFVRQKPLFGYPSPIPAKISWRFRWSTSVMLECAKSEHPN